MCFLFVHTNAPDRSDVPASSVLYCCVLGRQAVDEMLEDALGAPASSYEALLLSAGKCRQSSSKSWIRRLALNRQFGAISLEASLSAPGPR